jgi:hypothetical protein
VRVGFRVSVIWVLQIVIEGVDEADTKPSAVGAKIAETLSKKIAALVILMVTDMLPPRSTP